MTSPWPQSRLPVQPGVPDFGQSGVAKRPFRVLWFDSDRPQWGSWR